MRSDKKGAMEMSIGTIVVIVLSMSMLILGMVLIKNIMGGANQLIDTSHAQTLSKLNELYGSDEKVVILPVSRKIEVKQDKPMNFAIGIKNRLSNEGSSAEFGYEVSIANSEAVIEDCQVSASEIMSFISAGTEKESGITLATGESYVSDVMFETTKGDPLCTVKFRIEVSANDKSYDTKSVLVTFR